MGARLRQAGRRPIAWILKLLARRVVGKYRPRIVAVTGSVGKTTTKDLIAAMLEERFRVRASANSCNSEFGLPLTVIGENRSSSPNSPASIWQWFGVIRAGASLVLQSHDYPEVLVLEMGADRPGDVRYLTGIAPPDVAVVTNLHNVHRAHYSSLESIAEEKSWVVRALKPGGLAFLNMDDTKVRMMAALVKSGSTQAGSVVTFGVNQDANVWADQVKLTSQGLTGRLHLREKAGEPEHSWDFTSQLLSPTQLYSVLAAFGVAYSVGVVPEHALDVIARFTPAPGRMRVFDGRGGLTILDDTCNASPEAMVASLEVLQQFPKPHWAVLGDMKELGDATAAGHRMVGEFLAPWLDELVVVGEDAAVIAEGARAAGLEPEHIHFATRADQAVKLVDPEQRGGTVLVKGSPAVSLEHAVAKLLADPRDARHLVQRMVRGGGVLKRPVASRPVGSASERVK